MLTYTDTIKFNNHSRMVQELTNAGVEVGIWTEAELVYQYNLQFLFTPNWKFTEESRRYRPSGTRISSGPYEGKFPSIGPKEK